MSITVINLSHKPEELPKIIENWGSIPQNVKELLLNTTDFRIVNHGQGILFYNGRQILFDCMSNVYGKKIEILNIYNDNGLVWKN